MRIPALLAAATLFAAHDARAFCGFYVAGGDQQMFNDATEVVLMRDGTRTVLSMQNNYKGPPQDFALVIPVPVVLHEGDVKTLNKEVFAHVDAMGAPRLVEYWEQDPCMPNMDLDEGKMGKKDADKAEVTKSPAPADLGVRIEAKFTVGEYQIVILSAKDSTGLDTWLHQENYKIPDGAGPLLRPYVEANMKFFVAKVDPKKVKFENGRAALSPLRFHYDSDEFALPIRLGLANSAGTQDLIVNIFARNQRYEVANYKNVTIPTNIDVDDSIKGKFGSFYAALFDRTLEKNPGAVVTEYAWAAQTCDPCPGPTLQPDELTVLGADVLGGDKQINTWELVLTRLHARYGKDIKDDLQFKAAPPIVGGREFVRDNGRLEEGARPDSMNNFQGRYAIRHEWTGPIRCENPTRHIWGGPPAEIRSRTVSSVQPGTNLAFAPRNTIALPEVVKRDVPEIGIKAGTSNPFDVPPLQTGSAVAPPRSNAEPKSTAQSGCGCESTDRNGVLGGALVVGAVLLSRRKRK